MNGATRQRLLVAGAIALPFGLYGWAILVSTAIGRDGVIGPHYNAPGTDWAIFYTAARGWLEGNLAHVYDQVWLRDRLNAAFAHWLEAPMAYPAFHYPPPFLLLFLPFGAMPFVASYLSAQAASAAGLGASLRAAFGRERFWFLALALLLSPASSNNVLSGQDMFFVCMLYVIGFALLDKRPLWAGVALGFLCLKPQYGLLVPVALIAARQWRVFAVAAATALLLSLLSAAVFGIAFWQDWIALFVHPRQDVAYTGLDWGRMWDESAYTCAALLGASKGLADAVQTAATLSAAALVYITYGSQADPTRKLCILLAAAVVASPHVSPYDMILLAAAAALYLWDAVAQETYRPLHLMLPLAVWLLPLFNPPRAVMLGLATPVLIFAFVLFLMQQSQVLRPKYGLLHAA